MRLQHLLYISLSFWGAYAQTSSNGRTSATFSILINQIGYEVSGPKKAIIQSSTPIADTLSFKIINTTTNKVSHTGWASTSEQVDGWGERYYRTVDFGALQTAGKYKISARGVTSYEFEIAKNMLFNKTASSVVSFFKSMRSTNTADANLPFYGTRTDKVNVSGGWKDASGDPGKHMSHLSYANFFNPQQIPMVTWALLKSYEICQAQYGSTNATATLAEAAYGADYLVKNVDPQGYLYLSIFDDWGGSTNRQICEWGKPNNGGSITGADKARSANYQAAMREGAGMAIAALARAKTMNLSVGNNAPAIYLAKAESLYNHLKAPGDGYPTKNIEYCNNHLEGIIDFYCGLIASTELYKATNNGTYLQDARSFASKLMALQDSKGNVYCDEALTRPYYHAADEGLPLYALGEYYKIDTSLKSKITTFVTKWTNRQIELVHNVSNPFMYQRQYQKPWTYADGLGAAKEAFFIPHSNETEYWWQGENARLASLTAGWLSISRTLFNKNLSNDTLSQMAMAQLDWILGKNPFDVCMITGFGKNTYPGYGGRANITGGICNGITSDETNESEPAWIPYAQTSWMNWRWIEQWLPHDSWYLLAISEISNTVNYPVDCSGSINGSAYLDKCGKCVGGNTNNTPCVVSTLTDIYIHNEAYISPNPVKESLHLSQTSSSFQIYDSYGRVIMQSHTLTQSIPTNGLVNGIYYIKLAFQEKEVIMQFVKE